MYSITGIVTIMRATSCFIEKAKNLTLSKHGQKSKLQGLIW